MAFLVTHRANELQPSALADVFDRLIWVVDEKNSAEILEERLRWLNGDDPLKVEIALLMGEVFPYDNRPDLERNLFQLSAKWPQFQKHCEAILNQWDNL